MMNIILRNDVYQQPHIQAEILLQKSKLMFGQLGEEAIETILHHQLIGHIGCHANDTTYVVPISYAYEDGYVYAHTHEGMKINMMRQNPKVCFEVHTMENMGNWQSVIAWGNFEEVTDEQQREKALRILIKRELPIITSKTVHLTEDWPFLPDNLNSIEGIVFCIKLTIKTGRYENTEIIPY